MMADDDTCFTSCAFSPGLAPHQALGVGNVSKSVVK